MFIQCQDVCIGDILEIADLAPCREEPHETVVTLLTVISLAILTDLCPLLAELQERDGTCSFTLQPLLNRKDVHYALAHHLKNDLANLSHEFLQRLVQFTGIGAVNHSSPVPMFWQEPDACCHVLLFPLKCDSELNSCLPVRSRCLFAVVDEL